MGFSKKEIAIGLVFALFMGCAHFPRRIEIRDEHSAPIKTTRALWKVSGSKQERERIAKVARHVVGKSHVTARGKSYRADCSGTVRGIYAEAGFPIKAKAKSKTENDVSVIYEEVLRDGSIYGEDPLPGDLVFFHDTFDPKGAKDNQYLLTHIGVVEKTESDGTVIFVHHFENGIIESKMNLSKPCTSDCNVFIRRSEKNRKSLVAAQLFAGYGRLAL